MILSIRFLRGAVNDSGWVDCATLVNGAQNYADYTTVKRRVIDFKKFKIVQIRGVITLPQDAIPKNTDLVNLPAGLPTSDGQGVTNIMPGTYATTVRWGFPTNGRAVQIGGYTLDPSITAGLELWFPIDITYISQ